MGEAPERVMKHPRWEHQAYARQAIWEAIDQGETRICVQTPTGGGKTEEMKDAVWDMLQKSWGVVLYTNRRALLEQTSDEFAESGIGHGVRAAGWDDMREHRFQISSIQTEAARVFRAGKWKLHQAKGVLIDEGHLHTGPEAVRLRMAHRDAGAVIIDFTATPVEMGDVCDVLIIAGTISELRACGALALAYHYAPTEPDWRELRKIQNIKLKQDNNELLTASQSKYIEGRDFTEAQVRYLMGRVQDGVANPLAHALHGRVWEWYQKLNPNRYPALLFAAGVPEGVWFAEKFYENGVRSAFVGGEGIWIDGEMHRATPALRREVMAESKAGKLPMLTTRYVFREGINAPWLFHGIFATIFGSVVGYLQSAGRLLRKFPAYPWKVFQDHGGNWWRHGSVNQDREWELEYTAKMMYDLRKERILRKTIPQPFLCPRCQRTWTAGTVCQVKHGGCGFELGVQKRSRPVMALNGELKAMTGDIFRPRRVMDRPDGPAKWERMYYRAKSKKWDATFNEAMGLFARENDGWYPSLEWPMMPIKDRDMFRRVSEVPKEALTK